MADTSSVLPYGLKDQDQQSGSSLTTGGAAPAAGLPKDIKHSARGRVRRRLRAQRLTPPTNPIVALARAVGNEAEVRGLMKATGGSKR